MTEDTTELAARLRRTGERIAQWRQSAERIKGMTAETLAQQRVEDGKLVEIEEIAGEIYREIEAYDGLVANIADRSPKAAAELAEVGEALHLVLLEITELGTAMYSVRSGMPNAVA